MPRRGIRESAPIRGGRTVDMQRMMEALKGPGMDTRTWISNGIVQGTPYFEEGAGWFADVILEPSGIGPVQCRMGSAVYANAGFGMLAPLHDGDEVEVRLPEGNPNSGPTVGLRPNGPMALPPAGWNNDSIVIVSDVPIRLVGSDVSVGAATDSSNPAANNPPADEAVLGTTYRSAEDSLLTAIQAAIALLITNGPAFSSGGGATMATALTKAGWGTPADPVTVFTAKAAQYLSKSLKVGK